VRAQLLSLRWRSLDDEVRGHRHAISATGNPSSRY